MYFGPFYFDTKELFLILGSLLLALSMVFGWEISWFDRQSMLTLVVLMLITKGLLPAIHNEAFFILALVAIFLTLYFPIFTVVLFYLVSFLFFRILRVI